MKFSTTLVEFLGVILFPSQNWLLSLLYSPLFCVWLYFIPLNSLHILIKIVSNSSFEFLSSIVFFVESPNISRILWHLSLTLVSLSFRENSLKVCYKPSVLKIVWYWQKYRPRNKWNRVDRLEINLCMCDQLIFGDGAKIKQWGNDTLPVPLEVTMTPNRFGIFITFILLYVSSYLIFLS